MIPLEEHEFTLNKGEFRDPIAIRYNKALLGLSSQCHFGQKHDVTPALNCKKGGFVTIRHNDIRDFEANLLSKICSDVELEPALQPITDENTRGLTGDESRPDIRVRGFWRKGQNAYFEIRVNTLHIK